MDAVIANLVQGVRSELQHQKSVLVIFCNFGQIAQLMRSEVVNLPRCS